MVKAIISPKALVELAVMSRRVGRRQEYVQGGGGNTSAKVAGGRMLVKASGCLLKEVTLGGRGLVSVAYEPVREFYACAVSSAAAGERQGAAVVAENTSPICPGSSRASIEAGFHSLLGLVVLHTHSVWANVLACAREGEEALGWIGDFSGSPAAWVPYARPGFELTVGLQRAVRDYRKLNGREPEVIFLQNHGVIVSSRSAARCESLHEAVNAGIREHLGLPKKYPSVRLKEDAGGGFVDSSGFLAGHLARYGAGEDYFASKVICPDQVVYGFGGLSFGRSGRGRITVDVRHGTVRYQGTRKEAEAAAETVTSVAFVLETIHKLGWRPGFLRSADIRAIMGMDAEKYRQQLLKR